MARAVRTAVVGAGAIGHQHILTPTPSAGVLAIEASEMREARA